MANPLSPVNEARLNIQTPTTALRGDQSDFVNDCTTPSKQNGDVINWDDDEDVNSSPFMTEAAESRAASREWRQATGVDTAIESEINAIFEDPQTPEEQPANNVAFEIVDDKENMESDHVQSSPKKPFSPLKARFSSKLVNSSPVQAPMSSSRPSSRDADALAMPPPSAMKSGRFPSPRKIMKAAVETPLPPSRDSMIDDSVDSGKQMDESIVPDIDVDDTSAGVDETYVDDTCFSNFSVIPEMTLFSKLGDKKSVPEDEYMVCYHSTIMQP